MLQKSYFSFSLCTYFPHANFTKTVPFGISQADNDKRVKCYFAFLPQDGNS